MIDATLERELHLHLSEIPAPQQRQVLDFARALRSAHPKGVPGSALLEFAGSFAPDDLAEMSAAIEAGCERVDPDGW